MGELTFRSAGVSTREIDLSTPTYQPPVGTPAGIIGTSLLGPAFIPLTFGSYDDFSSVFGATNGSMFGPIAMNEWLRNASAGTFLRVLGVGDGKERDASTGIVKNAGFVVGSQLVQENGRLGNNPYAVHGQGAQEGRTYFLGAFHSESNGSTIFSEAGIQNNAAAKVQATAKLTIPKQSGGDSGTNSAVPLSIGDIHSNTLTLVDTAGGSTVLEFDQATAAHTGNKIGIQGVGNQKELMQRMIASINANVANITAADGSTHAGNTDEKIINLTQDVGGAGGNSTITLTNTNAMQVRLLRPVGNKFSGGSGPPNHAVPIVRGILMAASGVILHLSGNNMEHPTAPLTTETCAAAGSLTGRKGGITGSVDMASKEFVMLMNGFKGSPVRPLTHITASFDPTAQNSIARVFNTNPFKIQEHGHVLYGYYNVHPRMAIVTGSDIIPTAVTSPQSEDVAFLLTGSEGRGLASTSEHVDYEDFQDRFTHAETPFITSQGFDSPGGYDLFKVVSSHAGLLGESGYKISIQNLVYNEGAYGKFDLVIRSLVDTDEKPIVLESHAGVTLDPGADNYIGRIIGDQHIFFNFDSNVESQKIVVDGTFPVVSRYVRVVLSDAIKKGEVPVEALPFGFRGPAHINTSGSILTSEPDGTFLADNLLNKVVEPPFPMRKVITTGTGIGKTLQTDFYWGVQSNEMLDPADPSKTSVYEPSLDTWSRHFPDHRIGVTPFAVGNNPGVADLTGGTVLDSDRFNNNRFSLEKIKIKTGSDGRADPGEWADAIYVRNGNIPVDDDAKTRKLKASDMLQASNKPYVKFTVPVQGGFNGTDIFNRDKFLMTNNAVRREMVDANQGELEGPTVAAYRKALDIMGSKTDSDIQLLAIPGIRHPSVTDYAISTTETRFDAMYLMDIEMRDEVNSVITSSVQSPHVQYTVNDFTNRALDSSFAAAYFPDVTIADPTTAALVEVPPSCVVIGAFAANDNTANGHPWTAPAGFTRGALGAVEQVMSLDQTARDSLYSADINPIAEFPGAGVTVWGQKTLLRTASALDRVNVRRLLIFVRRKVRDVARTLLFEPNRTETLAKFSGLVSPILQAVQDGGGVDKYKVAIDTTTTTQADIENNTIRGKIYLQPTRTVEFIALDFTITNAGSELFQ